MSLAKKCDICGKFYEHYETLVDGYPKKKRYCAYSN